MCVSFTASCLSAVEVYLDEKRKTYQDLCYKRFNLITIWKALFSRTTLAAAREVRSFTPSLLQITMFIIGNLIVHWIEVVAS